MTAAPAPAAVHALDFARSPATRPAGGDLGKQDFLKLLIAQLRNQDPLKPMEDREFITQLAQFHAVEALENLSKLVEVFRRDQQITEATLLIGKYVEAEGTDGSKVKGPVSEVRMVDGYPKLVIGDAVIDFGSVLSVGGAPAESSTLAQSKNQTGETKP